MTSAGSPTPTAGPPAAPAPGRRTVRHPDRVGLDPWLLGSLAAASAVLGGIAGQLIGPDSWPPANRAVVGAGLGLLAVVARPSISVRLASRLVLFVSTVALVRWGVLTNSLLGGAQGVLAWLAAAVTVFVLTDRAVTDAAPPMAGPEPGPARGPGAGRSPGRARLARTVLAVTAAVLLVTLVVTPQVLPHFTRTSRAGIGPQLDQQAPGSSVLRASDQLDMTTRPDLTDEVVFTVTSDRGTFWRGQTYDQWDGRTWTQSEPARFPVGLVGQVTPGFDDLGAGGGDRVVQRVRFESAYADVLFAAASAVEVDAGRAVAQRADGTLVTAGAPFGRGGAYTVVSRRPVLSEERLRAVEGGSIPADIRRRYASAPDTTARVRAAARSVTADSVTTYDRVRALEAWMGDRTEYSLEAPLSPPGVDVVDHFLFQSRQGWCEQVASSLVVLARADGIPARLVTGFVPGELDRVTGSYVVRQRDAHAWAEVWFPEVGWVPFDPTADVPLAGADRANATIGRWLIDHAVILVLGAAAVALVVGPLIVLVRRWHRRRTARPVGWVAIADARLVALGRRVRWPRSDAETATAFAASLGRHLGEPRLAEVGTVIDSALYAPVPPDAAARARVDTLLDELAHAEPPAAEPVGDASAGSGRGGR